MKKTLYRTIAVCTRNEQAVTACNQVLLRRVHAVTQHERQRVYAGSSNLEHALLHASLGYGLIVPLSEKVST